MGCRVLGLVIKVATSVGCQGWLDSQECGELGFWGLGLLYMTTFLAVVTV